MKYFDLEKIDSVETLRNEFKKLCFKLHPDKGGNETDFKNMQNEFESCLKFFSGKKTKTQSETQSEQKEGFNYTYNSEFEKNLMNVIINLVNYLDLTLEVCGSWLWVTGDTKKHKDLLKSLNCRYHAKKTCWFFCDYDESKKTFRSKELDMNEIRLKHGSKVVKSKSNIKTA